MSLFTYTNISQNITLSFPILCLMLVVILCNGLWLKLNLGVYWRMQKLTHENKINVIKLCFLLVFVFILCIVKKIFFLWLSLKGHKKFMFIILGKRQQVKLFFRGLSSIQHRQISWSGQSLVMVIISVAMNLNIC